MLVSHDYKFIYIKSKKTASTSIQDYLEPYCRNGIVKRRAPHSHLSATKVKALVGDEIWNSYLKITPIRNPWDKMVSLYFWRRNRKRPWYLRIRLYFKWGTFRNPAETYSFKDFIELLESKKATNVDKRILLVDGQMPDYYFVRFEHLHEDLETLCGKLGIPYESDKLPKKKVGLREKRDYKQLYDDKTKKIVEDAYPWETHEFGYTF